MRLFFTLAGIALAIAAIYRLNVRLYSGADRTPLEGMMPQSARQFFVEDISGSWPMDILALGAGVVLVIYANGFA